MSLEQHGQPTPEPRPSILVVEDERVVAMDISESLRVMGYDSVRTAHSAEECLNRAAEAPPDLVLMDIRIDGDIDGVQTAKVLRETYDPAVVFLTAYADRDTVARAKHVEPHGYLLKPSKTAELRSTVEIALFKHSTERRLRNRERWFDATLRAVRDGVLTFDVNGTVTYANTAAHRMLFPAVAPLGRHASDVVSLIDERTREPLRDLLDALRANPSSNERERFALVTRRGERPVAFSAASIRDSRGEEMGTVLVLRDVSLERTLREQLMRSDRLAALGTLAAGVAHEINNPLTFVLANAAYTAARLDEITEELEGDAPPPRGEQIADLRSLAHHLAEALSGVERIKFIVQDLSKFGRPEEGEAEVGGDVLEALHWAMKVARHLVEENAILRTELTDVPRVRHDTSRLGQVFVNLIINAAQAFDAADEARRPDNEVVVRTYVAPDEGVCVEVQDNGCGMDAEVMQRVFDPFFSTKPFGRGTGLGLAISHRIVESLGGSLTVASTVGEGSTFRVLLPLEQTRPT